MLRMMKTATPARTRRLPQVHAYFLTRRVRTTMAPTRDSILEKNQMGESLKARVQIFDPRQDYSVVHRRLPHWSHAGTISFITWRTWDSIPRSVLATWLAQRDLWLERHGIDPFAIDWRAQLARLAPTLIDEFQSHIAQRWNEHLDECHGECVLKRSDPAEIVAGSLRRFDGERYDLTDFVIMPNHVHLLVAFPDE